jgi:serine/threonine protein kinase
MLKEMVYSVVMSMCGSPNFLKLFSIFECSHKNAKNEWGYETDSEDMQTWILETGAFYYVNMELATEGDCRELMEKRMFTSEVARCLVFQVAAALYSLHSEQKQSIIHYDVKLDNIFIQKIDQLKDLLLKYSIGTKHFKLEMPSEYPYIAKLGDFGEACLDENDKMVTADQFTTISYTPPDYLILGDNAKQGRSHDMYGLGLCMLHLFAGTKFFDETWKSLTCPKNFGKKLTRIWKTSGDYTVIKGLDAMYSVVDEYSVVDQLCDALYFHLVLFGITSEKQDRNGRNKVWTAIHTSIKPSQITRDNRFEKLQYETDCNKYSICTGTGTEIIHVRNALSKMGGLELLLKLCNIDPSERGTAEDVMNHDCMKEFHVHK